ncbi:MAG: iron ABC transporter permease [Candidatus Caldarchaeum sp.]|nr:iron ABC transporter permease [Candidatus Caldarchaeum sp.]MCS7136803.1 iron ABC transporter permease [Candidatus Caldarchaeum sp.]MDW7977745.1 iron ABC transporter permease [Candidatus Caldarchaeum sp.]MDW8359075.1 iron ABC transporter permease [Candidatus Caldarchaeum sp.]
MAVVGLLVLFPISSLIAGSFWSGYPGYPGEWTLKNYLDAFADPLLPTLFINSLVYAGGASLLATLLAVFYAFITARTDTPGRGLLSYLPYIDLMTPALLTNIAWIYLLHPRVGLINNFIGQVFGPDAPVLNIYSLPGMIFITGLNTSSLVYIGIQAAFKSMNPEYEDVSRVCGAGIRRTTFSVTLKLTMPAILSMTLLNFIIVLEVFETPSMIGLPANIPVFMSTIYNAVSWSIPPKTGQATALAVILLMIVLTFTTVYRRYTARVERYAVITGRGYQPNVIKLGKWRYATFLLLMVYAAVLIVLPISLVLLLSFKIFWDPNNLFGDFTLKNYVEVLNHPHLFTAIINSTLFSAAAASILVFLIPIVVYLSRRVKARGASVVENVAMMPQAYPGLVLALGLLWGYITLPIGIYGTAAILVIAYVTRFMPHVTRLFSGVVVQIHQELEESSRVCGSGFMSSIRRIVLPLLRPAMVGAWVYAFIVSFRELSASVLLVAPGTEVISVLLWGLWINGEDRQFAAAIMILVGILALIISTVLLIARLIRARVLLARRP